MTAKEQLVNITLDKEVYCYGAGNYGKTVAYSLIDINVDFKGFIVTNKNNVSNYVMKKKFTVLMKSMYLPIQLS